jgi:hypothetical protein
MFRQVNASRLASTPAGVPRRVFSLISRCQPGSAVLQGYGSAVVDIGSRKRNQPAPPHVVFEKLTNPQLDPQRLWLSLLDDETRPRILQARKPDLVIWSSLFVKRPDARVRFDLPRGGEGTDLRWTLSVDEPVPDDALVGHMRKRLNQLINANLRYTFGQYTDDAMSKVKSASPPYR